jgi:Xaa-Pro dipeptidase
MLHFTEDEFAGRLARTRAEMDRRGLDAMLLFAPESQYWLTGYDTFGFCFFQCLVVAQGRDPVLLTRAPDLRQAQLTSTIPDVRIWKDEAGAEPARDLAALLRELGLGGRRVGWETATHGLTHRNGAAVAAAVDGLVGALVDVSELMGVLRLVKSPAEIACVRRAAELADLAWDAALEGTRAGAFEGDILAAMHRAIFEGDGDYPGNEFIIGSGDGALLCRYHSGRRRLDARDQLTLEWAGTYRHYHSALMKTIVIGEPRPRHRELQEAAEAALTACEAALRPGSRMADVYAAHARTFDVRGLGAHRLNACGYALGPRFSPAWMEDQMFYEGAPTVLEPDMVFFLHMILFDSEQGTAMTLGRTSLVTEAGAEPLSRMPLGLVVR